MGRWCSTLKQSGGSGGGARKMEHDWPQLPASIEILCELKSSENAMVVLAEDRREHRQMNSPRKVVLKCYPRSLLQNDPSIKERLENKLKNYHGLFHKHVLTYSEVRVTRSHLVVFFDFIEGGSLQDELMREGKFSETKARFYFQQIILVVDYMMRKGACIEEVSRRDLKLDNFLLTNKLDERTFMDRKIAVLYDFRLSTKEGLAGSKDSTDNNALTINLHNCGLCLYRMLTGEDWIAPSLASVSHQTNAGFDHLDQVDGLSTECKEFVRRMLHTDCRGRLSLDQIWENGWFTTDLENRVGAKVYYPDLRDYNAHVSSEHVERKVAESDQKIQDVLERVALAADRQDICKELF